MRNISSSNNNNKTNGHSSIMNNGGSDGNRAEPGSKEWEMRPGGMLVQMRTADSDRNPALVPTIRVRIKFGSIYHEVNISSQATFGNSSLFSVFFVIYFPLCSLFCRLSLPFSCWTKHGYEFNMESLFSYS